MKIRNNLHALLLIIIAACTSVKQTFSAQQMPIGKQNQQQSDANQQKFKNDPYFTLAVLQPAMGYRSLEAHVNDQKANLKQEGYELIPTQDWHLSVMIFAVPFPQQKISQAYVQQASDNLVKILNGYKTSLTDIEFQYKEMKSLGNHKFIAAMYERVGKKPFFRVYGDIVHDFFQVYPDSWMYYGYGMVPHVSVASKMKAAGQATATTIPGTPQALIKNLLLRHKGRKLEIAARYYDPKLCKLVELKSQSV